MSRLNIYIRMTRNPRRRNCPSSQQTVDFTSSFMHINGNNLFLQSQRTAFFLRNYCLLLLFGVVRYFSDSFFHSTFQMQITFPSVFIYFMHYCRPVFTIIQINKFFRTLLPPQFFSRTIIRHPVETIFLSLISIMSFC